MLGRVLGVNSQTSLPELAKASIDRCIHAADNLLWSRSLLRRDCERVHADCAALWTIKIRD